MNETILSKLLTTCPFPEVYEDTEQISDSAFPVPKQKIGHIRADHDGWRWHNTVWPCHKALATNACCQEIDRIYEELTAPQALKDLPALCAFCRAHMDACISKEYEDEFSFFYVGTYCNFWLRLITRKGDYNLYLTAYAKDQGEKKYFDFLEKLRKSGETNMYGATANLQDAFSELRYNRKKAEEIHLSWIASFDREEDNLC